MVDFAKENVIDVQSLAKRLNVSPDTIRRWFRQGLERVKLGGSVYTSLEALNRFSNPLVALSSVNDQHAQQMLRELRERGLVKGITDGGRNEKARTS